jgi:hypothetical protein
MYSLHVEVAKSTIAAAGGGEEGLASPSDELAGHGAIEFSVGNPRVEHITGVVHLYRSTPAVARLGSGVELPVRRAGAAERRRAAALASCRRSLSRARALPNSHEHAPSLLPIHAGAQR